MRQLGAVIDLNEGYLQFDKYRVEFGSVRDLGVRVDSSEVLRAQTGGQRVRVYNRQVPDGIYLIRVDEAIPETIFITEDREWALTKWTGGYSYVRAANLTNRKVLMPKDELIGSLEVMDTETLNVVRELSEDLERQVREEKRRNRDKKRKDRDARVRNKINLQKKVQEAEEAGTNKDVEIGKDPTQKAIPGIGFVPKETEEETVKKRIVARSQLKEIIWQEVLSKYLDVFKHRIDGKVSIRGCVVEIETGQAKPLKNKMKAKGSPMEEKLKEDMVKDLESRNLIKPGMSDWRSNLLVIPKPDGSGWRAVVDYRKLNEVTVEDTFPLPNIEDILRKLKEANFFTKLDLTDGFWQLKLSKRSRKKTAFSYGGRSICGRGCLWEQRTVQPRWLG